jgi:hypothetical protein
MQKAKQQNKKISIDQSIVIKNPKSSNNFCSNQFLKKVLPIVAQALPTPKT